MVRQGCDYKGPSFGTAVPEAHSSFGPAVKEIIDGTARLRLKDLLSMAHSSSVASRVLAEGHICTGHSPAMRERSDTLMDFEYRFRGGAAFTKEPYIF